MPRADKRHFEPGEDDPASVPASDDPIGGDSADRNPADDDIGYQYEDPNDDR